MKLFLHKLLLPGCLAVIFASCHKNHTPDAGGSTLDKVVSQYSNQQQNIKTTVQYQYDGSQRLVLVTGSSSQTTSIDSTKFTYDANGRLSQFVISSGSNGIARYNIVYDGNGKMLRAVGTPILQNLAVDDYTFAWDAQGRLATDSSISGLGQHLYLYHKYTYDAANNIIQAEQYDNPYPGGSWQFSGKQTATYDGHSNPLYSNALPLFVAAQCGEWWLLSAANRSSVTSVGASSTINDSYANSYYTNSMIWRVNSSSSATNSYPVSYEYFYKAP